MLLALRYFAAHLSLPSFFQQQFETDLLRRFSAALDFLAGLDGAHDDADGNHQDRDVLGERVATAKVVHARQHTGD